MILTVIKSLIRVNLNRARLPQLELATEFKMAVLSALPPLANFRKALAVPNYKQEHIETIVVTNIQKRRKHLGSRTEVMMISAGSRRGKQKSKHVLKARAVTPSTKKARSCWPN